MRQVSLVATLGYEVEQLISATQRVQPSTCGRSFLVILVEHADPQVPRSMETTAFAVAGRADLGMSFTTLSDEEERELYRLSGLRLRLRLGVGMFLVRPAPAVAVQEKFRNALPHFAGQRHLRIRVVNDESARLHFAIFLVLTR